ncbi:hypothetical protein KGF54_002521 [Candida jiufengensis]|uniref:uncharacterized protein n=1 Tax=Candida jiufengensis TaxID=497108 RepID=UPI00222502DC|nr:uncharacterized protein KGF54_002521 [Candida jiufengensis]KAI5953150.1 hypothetical protein KGF54_002521 [Candida jiufengensis]
MSNDTSIKSISSKDKSNKDSNQHNDKSLIKSPQNQQNLQQQQDQQDQRVIDEENQTQPIPIFNPISTQSRKIQPSLQLINNTNKINQIYNDPKITAIHETLNKSGTLFITSIYCFMINLNNTKYSNTEKLDLFIQFYINEQFKNLPFLGEIELNKEEYEIVLNLFNDLFFNYNFITLSGEYLKNKNKFQLLISDWFKKRGVIMETNKEFMREILSAGLNDWFLHLQR